MDLLTNCPAVGQLRNAAGKIIACVSHDRDNPNSHVAKYFDAGCSQSYSWSGDDSVMAAYNAEDFDIVFCRPTEALPSGCGGRWSRGGCYARVVSSLGFALAGVGSGKAETPPSFERRRSAEAYTIRQACGPCVASLSRSHRGEVPLAAGRASPP